MHLHRLLPPACLAASMALSLTALPVLQAKAMSKSGSDGLQASDPMTLQEPSARLNIRLVPGTTLARGYQSPFYRQDTLTGAITLQTDGLQPAIRGESAPATVLRQGFGWHYQQAVAEMRANIRIDVFPKNRKVLVARIQSAEGTILDLIADGENSRVVATLHGASMHHSVVAGTLSADHVASVTITSHPDGQLDLTVNGTRSVLPMPSPATAQAMWFEAAAGEVGWHAPWHSNLARVTFTRLSMSRSAP